MPLRRAGAACCSTCNPAAAHARTAPALLRPAQPSSGRCPYGSAHAAAASVWPSQEREANREAVSSKAEESAALARKAAQQAQRLRQQKEEERQRLMEEKNLTWNQKVGCGKGGGKGGPW